MKITFESAVQAIALGHIVVKDDQAKAVHHRNIETGETFITYKTAYFLQSPEDPRIQRQITAAIAKKLCKQQGKSLEDVQPCFEWSSLKKD